MKSKSNKNGVSKPTRLGTIPTRPRRRRKPAEVASAVKHARVVALRAELDVLNQTLIEATARRAQVYAEMISLGVKRSTKYGKGCLEAETLKIVQRGPITTMDVALGLGRASTANGTHGSSSVLKALQRLAEAGRVRQIPDGDRVVNLKWEFIR